MGQKVYSLRIEKIQNHKRKGKKNVWHYIQITERDSKVMEFWSDTQLLFFLTEQNMFGVLKGI